MILKFWSSNTKLQTRPYHLYATNIAFNTIYHSILTYTIITGNFKLNLLDQKFQKEDTSTTSKENRWNN